MAHRKPRYGLTPQHPHVRYREDADPKQSTLAGAGRWMRALKEEFSEEHLRSQSYWRTVFRSFWGPFKRHALNLPVAGGSAALLFGGLVYGYWTGINPERMPNGPKAYMHPSEQLNRDFEQLKQDLGMGDANVKLMITRDGPSPEFNHFSMPYTFGSKYLSRGATVCLPRVFFEPKSEHGENELAALSVGKTTFEWDTLNGQAARRLLVLPRDEIRFMMGKGLLLADEHYEFKRRAKLPVLAAFGFFFYSGFIAPGIEYGFPNPGSLRLKIFEIAFILVGMWFVNKYVINSTLEAEVRAENKLSVLGRRVKLAGANFLERIATFRLLIREELGPYTDKYITENGELLEFLAVEDLENRTFMLRSDSKENTWVR